MLTILEAKQGGYYKRGVSVLNAAEMLSRMRTEVCLGGF